MLFDDDLKNRRYLIRYYYSLYSWSLLRTNNKNDEIRYGRRGETNRARVINVIIYGLSWVYYWRVLYAAGIQTIATIYHNINIMVLKKFIIFFSSLRGRLGGFGRAVTIESTLDLHQVSGGV